MPDYKSQIGDAVREIIDAAPDILTQVEDCDFDEYDHMEVVTKPLFDQVDEIRRLISNLRHSVITGK